MSTGDSISGGTQSGKSGGDAFGAGAGFSSAGAGSGAGAGGGGGFLGGGGYGGAHSDAGAASMGTSVGAMGGNATDNTSIGTINIAG